MNCHRCHGLMVPTWIGEDHEWGSSLPAQKCLLCGYVEDAVMRKRRLAMAQDQDAQGTNVRA